MLKFSTVQQVLDGIEEKIKTFSDEDLAELRDIVQTTTWEELAAFQTLQAESHAMQRIDLDTASWLFKCLGGEGASVEKWRELELHEQYTVLEVIKVLHKMRTQ